MVKKKMLPLSLGKTKVAMLQTTACMCFYWILSYQGMQRILELDCLSDFYQLTTERIAWAEPIGGMIPLVYDDDDVYC